MRKTRVLIVDDSITIRAMVERLIDSQPDLEVIGITACAEDARKFRETHDPDVITLDIEMPGMDGLQFLESIMTVSPVAVVMLSSRTSRGDEITAKAMALGAAGCFNKADVLKDSKSLLKLIRAAAAGKTQKAQRFAGVMPEGNAVSNP